MLLVLLACSLLSLESYSQISYTSAGTYTFTVPVGISKIKVECWGAGGAGGGNTSNRDGAGGGGGGAYSCSYVTVIPGNTYTVTVGAGGNGTTGAGASGGDTWFGTSSTILAVGGNGGNPPVSGAGGIAGAGGNSTSCIGDYAYSGGNGGTGRDSNTGRGGPGGSSAGNTSNGTSGTITWTTTVAGPAPANAGQGGNGGGSGSNGSGGFSPGGGGGGAGDRTAGNRTGGDGADGQVLITLPGNIILSSPNQISDGDLYQGDDADTLAGFITEALGEDATIRSVTFSTSGTYASTDITHFQLWYNTSNDLGTATQIGSDITTSLGTGTHTFSGLSQVTPAGNTSYFWITAGVSASATTGAAISVDILSATDLTYDMAITSGNTTDPGTLTIQVSPGITLSSANPAVAAANVSQTVVDHLIYEFTTTITNADALLNSVTFSTTGTATGSDLVRFKLWYNTTNSLSTANKTGSDIISDMQAGAHTFTGISQTISAGTTGYFWITVDIAEFPTNGNTVSVSALTTSDLTFERGILSGSAYGGDQQTISVVNGILLSSTHPAVSATSLLQGSTDQRIFKFTNVITGTNRTINSISFTTDGTYDATDILNFRLYYNTTNSLVSATQIGSTITGSLGAGTHTFSGLSQTILGGTTGYFWITTDVALTATPGRTLWVVPVTTSDLTYSSGSLSGFTYAGGIQTIQLLIDSDGNGVADLYDWDDDDDGIPDNVENAHCNTTTIELFPNSDFSSGNSGFSSAYGYAAPAGDHTLWPEGLYTIVTNPSTIHAHFAACGDHTSGSGNMMVVNGDPTTNKIVWSSGNISVTPNTDYTLSLYLSSVTSSNPAQLIWNVNGENIGTQFNATSTNCQWVHAVANWNSGSNTSASFDIVNLNTIASGNDFALDDISCKYNINCDSDGDGIQDRLDLDSDNDGIFDVYEAGGTDSDFNGMIDGFTDADGDGLSDNADDVNSGSGAGEITSGTPLPNSDTDSDGTPDFVDSESDGDLCFDTQEAGFTDGDDDGILGSSPVSVDVNGVVTSGTGYSDPADLDGNGTDDFIQVTPLITVQPIDVEVCLLSTTTAGFSITATNSGGSYQWQLSTDGGTTFTDISGANAATLNLTGIVIGDHLNQYRALLSHPAYRCSPVISDTVTLSVFDDVPATPGTITGLSTVCPSINTSYSVSSQTDALSYSWTVPSGWTITSGNGTESIQVTSGTSGSGTISVVANNLCGSSTASTLAVTINTPTPTITTPVAASVCQASDITYTTQSGMSNYDWNITTGSLGADYTITSGGGSDDETIVVRWTTTGSRTVTVNYASGGCSSASPASKTVNVLANVIISSQPTTPPDMCSGTGSETLSVSVMGTVSSYQWQISTDGGATWSDLSDGGPYSNVTTASLTITNPTGLLDNAQYRCLVTGTCGTVTSNAVTLTVNETTIDSQSTTGQTVCIGSAFSPVSVSATGSMLTYQWYSNTLAATSGGSSLGPANGAQTDQYTPQSASAGTLYYYCVVSGTCGSQTSGISEAFVTLPDNTITRSSGAGTDAQTVCVNSAIDTISYATTGATGATFTGLPTGVSGSWAADTVNISGTPTASGTFNYTITLTGGCGSVTETGSIEVNVDPSPSISGTMDICEESNYIYSTAANGNSFAWTVTGGTIDSGQGTEEISVSWDALVPEGTLSGSGSVEVVETIGATGCSATDTYSVTVHRTPVSGPVNHIDDDVSQ
ncbi:MAG: hypothetical protein JW801_14870 [Bacteroidales bacterium]|nr:hypothetical protein [Bacteroidales bacterium]